MAKKNEVMLPEQFQEVVQTSELELTKAEKIAVNYVPLMNQVQEQMDKLKRLKSEDPQNAEAAKRIRIDLGKVRSAVRDQKDEDKRLIKIEGNLIQSFHNTVYNSATLTIEEAKEIEEREERLEKQRKEALAEERKAKLAPYVENVESMDIDLGGMEEEIFEAYLNKKEQDYHDLLAAQKRAEEEKREQERLAELYADRKELLIPYWNFLKGDQHSIDFSTLSEEDFNIILNEVKQAKKEDDEKKAELEKEVEKAREREAKRNERASEMRPYIVYIRDYDAMIEMSDEDYKKALSDVDRAHKEQVKYEAEQQAKLKEERLEKRRLEQEEQDRKKAELEAQKEAEKKAKAPDKVKLQDLANDLSNFEYPGVKSDEAKEVLDNVKGLLSKVVKYINEEVENL